MAGIGRNPRHGKRPSSSSSSSYFSTVTMVVFVAFCILGLWMLTSSSIVPSHRRSRIATISSSGNRPPSRISRVNPLPAEDDDEIEDKPKPESSVSSTGEEETTQLESESGIGDSTQIEESGTQQETSTGGDERQDLEQQQQQQQQQSQGEEAQLKSEQQEIATKISEEQQKPQEKEQQNPQEKEQEGENQEEKQEQIGATDDSNQQESQQQEAENQEEKQEQIGGTDDSNQQESQQQEAENQEEKQEQIGATDDSNQQESQQQEAENQEETQQQIGATDEENQQETTQQQETGASGEETQQEIQEEKQQETEQEGRAETNDTHEETQQQNPEETQSQPESTTEMSEESQKHGEEELVEPNATISDGKEGKKSSWATQADQSENEKERRKGDEPQTDEGGDVGNLFGHEWELCNVTAGPDYIPCLDNEKAIKKLHIKHYEHRERHCPEESPTCLVPLPNGYKRSIEWPKSRERIWYNNVPRTKLAEVKGHQNWVKISGQYLTFPGGGTQFIHGALHYIDFIQQSVHDITWGKRTRVILDVGCGVASFGGYLFERDVLAMSFAPKDEHEAQVQFALERGIPAISAVMGSQRLPFPSRVFDLVHCARCRVPWHADGGTLLLELNRVLRPGGYFVWSATPVYQKLKEDVEIWNAMKSLTISMCWDLITIKKDKLNSVGAAFFRKPTSNECYDNRKHHSPPMCQQDDDPNAAWYIPMKTCMHRVPVDASERGSKWPDTWPRRLQVPPYWLNSSQAGIYGKPAPDDFTSDYEHWKLIVAKSYLSGLGIDWSRVRNAMDMRAVYGGFAAALKDLKVWVLNVVNVDSPDTLPIIYERGLFGIYHDWCESFSTYPRTYDLLHADRLFSQVKKRCEIVPVMVEIDRIMRPGGKLIVRDESSTVSEVESMLKSLHWEVRLTFSKDQEAMLCAEKSEWRPEKLSGSS